MGLLLSGLLETSAYGASAEYKKLMADAIYHLDFDAGDFVPQVGDIAPIAEAGTPVEGGRSGMGFNSVGYIKLQFPNSFLINPDKPGTLLIWVSPKKWEWSDDRPINTFFATPGGGGEGQLSISRQGYQHLNGQLVRLEALHFVIAMPDIPEKLAPLEPPTPETWADGSWHLLALSWEGSTIAFSVDGGPEREIDLGRPLTGKELGSFYLGGCAEDTMIDDFMIFGRRLSSEEIQTVYQELKPAE